MKFNETVEEILNEGSQNYRLEKILDIIINQLDDLKKAAKGSNGSNDPSLKKSTEITKPVANMIKELKTLKKNRGSESAWFRQYYS